MAHQAAERVLTLPHRVDLHLTLNPTRRGVGDHTLRLGRGDAWRVTRTPLGPSTTHLVVDDRAATVRATSWGPGAPWSLEHLEDLVGARDDDSPLTAQLAAPPRARGGQLLWDLHRRLAGLRIPRTRAVAEALVPTVVEQKVAGREARRSYQELVAALGEPAPGPAELVDGLLVPPDPAALAATPTWAFHRFGLEAKRAGTIRAVSRLASRVDALADAPLVEAYALLGAIPGVGPWSAAEVGRVALGDADAVSLGDHNLPHQVSWALARRPRGTDDEMLELLEPYRGQRGRVICLIVASGITAPRRGPRRPLRDIRHH